MHRAERLARGLLKPMNPYVSAILGMLTFCWGLWVVTPHWEVFGRAAVYCRMLDIAPEWAWGLWATSVGATILVSLYYARARFVAFGLGAAMWHWFTVSGMMWWGDWQNTAGLAYTFVGVYALCAYLNVRVNFVKQDKKYIE